MKSISLLSKRADLSAADFQAYYEDTHCWLGMQHFPFVRYTRNHVVADTDTRSVDFDCISEFAMAADFNGGDVMNSVSRALMVEDELKFMDPTHIRVASVREQTLVGTLDATLGLPRYVALFQGVEQPALIEPAVKAWLASVDTVRHASLDECIARTGQSFPYQALLWLTLTDEQATTTLPQVGDLPGLLAVVPVTTHATPPATLSQNFKAYLP